MDSRWNGGLILATALEVERAQAIRHLLKVPIGILPDRPDEPVRPFAIGLFDELKVLKKADVSISALRRATSAYVHSRRYYLASGQPGAMRYSLDGLPIGEVSEEDQRAARLSLQSLEEAHGRPATPASPPHVDKKSRIKSGLLPRRPLSIASHQSVKPTVD